MTTHDVIIIGAGAAGLMAAASAAARGLDVLLLEKNKKLGVKILMSGGTRCNITHNCDVRDIVSAFGHQGKFLHSPLAALPPADVVKKFNHEGVATKIELTGKIFPVSNKAIDVRDALVRMATKAGATILNEQAVLDIEAVLDTEAVLNTEAVNSENEKVGGEARTDKKRFVVSTSSGSFQSKTLLITTGGKSYPGCGTTGDGYAWAKKFGHSIVDTVPALVPILSDTPWSQALKGVTIEDTRLTVWQPQLLPANEDELSKSQRKKLKARSLVQREGSFLFTHWGFSGPSVLDVSKEVARHEQRKRLELVCDFLPRLSRNAVEDHLRQKKKSSGKQSVLNAIQEIVPQGAIPRRLLEALLMEAEVDPSTKNAELSNSSLARADAQIKACRFSVNGTLGFEKAEVTAGGVSLKEVDSKTMQSKCFPGLYFAGEVLDLDGPIGGFNFQSAFSTGWLAGQSVGD
jgi:predicted Rossmann fold flavoprotein